MFYTEKMETEPTIKRKRSHNYTPLEREMLLELIKKNIDIIENKDINGSMMLKKREAWDSITDQYNATATSGFRTWIQLRHLYDNMKQRSKCNIHKDSELKRHKHDIETSTHIIDDCIKVIKSEKKEEVNKFLDAHLNLPQISLEAIQGNQVPKVKVQDVATFLGDYSDCTNVSQVEDPIQVDSYEGCRKRNRRHELRRRNKLNMESLKDQYFKIRISNAKLERKLVIQRHKLELELLELRFQKLRQYMRINGMSY